MQRLVLVKKNLLLSAITFFIGTLCSQAQTYTITVQSNERVASLEMSPSQYNSWVSMDEFNNDGKRKALIHEIYQKFDDKFDFIFLVLNEPQKPANLNYFGQLISVSNAINGIGLSSYNLTTSYCSPGKLKSVMALTARGYLLNGPSLHELMHNWGNYIIKTKDWNGISEFDGIPHWGFTGGSTKGQLGGFKQSTLQTNVGGNPNNYSVESFGGFANFGNAVPYTDLELYLMGMIPLTDVANFDVFHGLTQAAVVGPNIEFTATSRITYNNDKILANAGGPRNPSSATSQKSFRLLTVVLTPAPLTPAEWLLLDDQAEKFGRTSSDGTPQYNFWEATRGLGTLETGGLNNALRTSTTAPMIVASGPTTFCSGSTVTLSASVSDPVQWYLNGSMINGATSRNFMTVENGVYSVRQVTGGSCSALSAGTNITIVTGPRISASGPTSICAGGSVTLTASAGNSFLWSNGATTKSIAVSSAGTYTAKVTDNNGFECSSPPVTVSTDNISHWVAKSEFKGTGRLLAMIFSIGTKVFVSLGDDGGPNKHVWEYESGTDSWTRKKDFPGPARYGGISFSIGNKGYIGLGFDGSYRKDFWEYNPDTDTWTQKADFAGSARNVANGFSIGTKGYVAGGYDGTITKDFWEYDPVSNSWTQKADLGVAGKYSAVAFSIGTKGYLGTGYGTGNFQKDFWEYDQTTNKWTQKADFAGTARVRAVGFSIGSKGYIGTGNDGSLRNDFWEYDPANNKWTRIVDFQGTPRMALGVSTGSKAYVGLGGGFNGSFKNDFWEFNLPTVVGSPVIVANSPTTFCEGGSVILTSNLAAGNQWYKDGLVIGNATGGSLMANSSGTYSAKAILNGCQSTPSNSIIVTVGIATPTIAANASTTLCSGESVTLASNADAGNQWYKDGVAVSGSTAQTYTATAAGNYAVRVSSNGCSSPQSNSIAITVNSLPATPSIVPAGTMTLCEGQVVSLSSSNATGNQWYKDGVAVSGATAQAYTATAAGNYAVRVSSNGCSSPQSNSIAITVNSLPATPSIVPAGTMTLCEGQAVSLTSSNATGNQWYKDGVAVSGATAQAYTATAAGNYAVRVSSNGCSSPQSNSIAITVNSLPATPSIVPAGTMTLCEGQAVSLTSSNATGNQWYKDGVAISGATDKIYNAGKTGNYFVIVSSDSGCRSLPSSAFAILVKALPTTPTISQNGNLLTSSALSGNQWFLNNVVIAGATGQQFAPQQSGNYSVQVTIDDCQSSMSLPMNIVLTTINPITTLPGVMIFPNPVTDNLYIRNSRNSKLSISLWSISGKLILTNIFNNSLEKIEMKNFSSGMYLLKVTDETNRTIIHKMIIKF